MFVPASTSSVMSENRSPPMKCSDAQIWHIDDNPQVFTMVSQQSLEDHLPPHTATFVELCINTGTPYTTSAEGVKH